MPCRLFQVEHAEPVQRVYCVYTCTMYQAALATGRLITVHVVLRTPLRALMSANRHTSQSAHSASSALAASAATSMRRRRVPVRVLVSYATSLACRTTGDPENVPSARRTRRTPQEPKMRSLVANVTRLMSMVAVRRSMYAASFRNLSTLMTVARLSAAYRPPTL